MFSKLTALTCSLALLCCSANGCAALLDAGFKEAQDHGDNARYENKSYGEHFLDSLSEDDDDDDECHSHTVIIVEES